jgi:hypothetical protein
MAKERNDQDVDLRFPVKGLDLSQAFSLQPPGTTPLGVNVRAYDPLTARRRGGQRPGLSKYVAAQVPGSGVLQELTSIVGVGYTAPGPTGGLVQRGAGSSGTGNTPDTFQIPVTSGNSVLVLVGTTGGYPGTVTDGAGNTYTRINNGSLASFTASAWLATGVAGGFASVTVTAGSPGDILDVLALELGATTGTESQGSPGGIGSDGVGVNWTASHAPDFVYVAVRTSHIVTRTAGAGYVDLINGTSRFAVAYLDLQSPATIGGDLAWHFAASDFWTAVQGGVKR